MTVTHNGENDEPKKSYRTILTQQIVEELGQLERPSSGLLLSGLSAGLDVGFSLFLMGVMLTLVQGTLSDPLVRILVANMYSVGFIFVILGRSELFTEHTTLAILPVLSGRATLRALGRLWALVYAANMLGGAAFAALAILIGPALGVIQPWAFESIAHHLVSHPWWVILLSAILAGWLMGLLSWLVTAGRDTISQVFFVWLVTTAIGLGGLHHSVVGTVEVLAGVFAGPRLGLDDYVHFIIWTTLGNALGGIFFVALIKFSHVVRGGHTPDYVDLDDIAANRLVKQR